MLILYVKREKRFKHISIYFKKSVVSNILLLLMFFTKWFDYIMF